jgi:hypothetical protein
VTISGHRLTNASVTASGQAAPLVKGILLAYPDDDHISVTLTIADSTAMTVIIVGGPGPGGYIKPRPVPIPLRQVPVPLILTVTPSAVQQPTQVILTVNSLV